MPSFAILLCLFVSVIGGAELGTEDKLWLSDFAGWISEDTLKGKLKD